MYISSLVVMTDQEKKQFFALRLFVGLKRIIEGSVCNNITDRRKLIKSPYVIKNRFYQGNFVCKGIADM